MFYTFPQFVSSAVITLSFFEKMPYFFFLNLFRTLLLLESSAAFSTLSVCIIFYLSVKKSSSLFNFLIRSLRHYSYYFVKIEFMPIIFSSQVLCSVLFSYLFHYLYYSLFLLFRICSSSLLNVCALFCSLTRFICFHFSFLFSTTF